MATTVIDEEGVDVGTTPTIYANQPPNKLICKINYSGAEAASAFTVGGTLAAYVKVVKPAADTAEYGTTYASTEFYLAHTGTRLPDSLAGTGDTITFDGPTGLTTLNPTIISSQGRPTDPEQAVSLYGSSVFALMPTEDWLRWKLCKDRSDTLFQPVPANATFPDGEFTANKPSDVATIMASLLVGGGQKYRIKCKDIGDSTWANTSVVWSTSGSAKNFMAGGGYLVIEPDPVSPPTLVGRYFITHAWVGVHIRLFDWPGAVAGSGRDGFCLSCSAIDAQVIIEDINFIDPDWSQDGIVPALQGNDTKTFVTVSNAKCFRVLRCKFMGGKRNLTFTDVWLAEVDYGDVGQTKDDFCDPANTCKHIGRWPSDDLILWMHGNRLCNVFDKVTGLHLDVGQYSTTIGYPGGNTTKVHNNTTGLDEYPATLINVGDFRIVGSRVYKCTIAGTTPLRTDASNPVPPLPSHTSGTAIDGVDGSSTSPPYPTFEYWGQVKDLPRQYMVVHDLLIATGGQVKQVSGTDHPAAQFLINSHGGPMPMVVFNCHCLTTEVLGLGIHCLTQTERNYFSFNSLLGPHEHPSGGFYFDQAIQNGPSAANNGKVRAYKNMAASIGAGVFAEGNVVVKGKSPGAGQSYPDHCNCSASDFTIGGDGAWRFSFQDDNADTIEDSKSALSKRFHSTGKRIGARHRENWPLQFRVVDANGQPSDPMSLTVSFAP